MIDSTDDKMPLITQEAVEAARAKKEGPRRICFATFHRNALETRRVPFGSELFPFKLVKNATEKKPYEKCIPIKNESEYKKIEDWIKKQGERVFLRDCLYASIALSENQKRNDKQEIQKEKTEIGELEYSAKKDMRRGVRDVFAIESLAKHCMQAIQDLDLYREADLICAVPSLKEYDLPSKVASIVSDETKKENITHHFEFEGEKEQLTNLCLEEKWPAWENTKLTFSGKDITGKKIILIDDKYQSGTTIQYVAMKLQEAGARHVYGLCMVKTMGDEDNCSSPGYE